MAKYLSATIEINGNPCGCSNKMVKYCIFFNNYTNPIFVVEREVIVANLRKTKLLSLCVLAVKHYANIPICFIPQVSPFYIVEKVK